METSEDSRCRYANITNNLSISFEQLLPRTAEDVGIFLSDAALALGIREADLARMLGVTRATLSGWKSRGVIPENHLNWFRDHLVEHIILGGRGKTADAGFRHAGIEFALALFRATDFNPFENDGLGYYDAIHLCDSYLEGLAALSLFVSHRLGANNVPGIEAGMDHFTGVIVSTVRSLVRGVGAKRRWP